VHSKQGHAKLGRHLITDEIVRGAGVYQGEEFLALDEDAQANRVRRLDTRHGIQRDVWLVVAVCVITVGHIINDRVVILDVEEMHTFVAADKRLIAVEAQALASTFGHLCRRKATYLMCERCV
jgi:hypothetical protein